MHLKYMYYILIIGFLFGIGLGKIMWHFRYDFLRVIQHKFPWIFIVFFILMHFLPMKKY